MAWSGPALLLGSLVAGWLTLERRTAPLTRPGSWLLEPLTRAYEQDRDGALLLYVAVQGLLLGVVWAYVGGALCRLAAVDLTQRGREPARAALTFARRHRTALFGAPVAFVLLWALPLAAAWLLASLGGLGGIVGGVLAPLVVLGVSLLALTAVVAGTLAAACGFLAQPAVALDDADLFDAVSRPITYALAGLPRLLALRLLFLAGVLLGSGWRLVRTLLAAGVALLALEHGLGAARWERVLSVLGARGLPADAARLGVDGFDVAAAVALALAGAALVALWLADLASRVACARTAVYLVLRRAVDGAPVDALRTPLGEHATQTAAQAGFIEVARVGEA